jgi:ribosomal protein L35
VKKRFKVRSGVLVAKKSGKRHGMRKKTTKLNNQKMGFFPVNDRDKKLIMQCIPHGLKGKKVTRTKIQKTVILITDFEQNLEQN